MERAAGDDRDVGVHGRVVVVVAALVLPRHDPVAIALEIALDLRVVDVEADPAAQQRGAQSELQLPT